MMEEISAKSKVILYGIKIALERNPNIDVSINHIWAVAKNSIDIITEKQVIDWCVEQKIYRL